MYNVIFWFSFFVYVQNNTYSVYVNQNIMLYTLNTYNFYFKK